MPSVFNAQLSELGTIYQVINVILSEAKYVALPNEVALKIKNDLNQGKMVSIKKENIDKPQSKDIPYSDFYIEEPKELDKMKSTAKSKVHQRISAYTALISAYDIFEFYMIQGKLLGMGFNVMQEQNKEEVYLNIINTGDEDLISDLERFLEVKDVFDNMMKRYRSLKRYFREIDECESEEELQEVIESNQGWLIN